MHQSQVFLARSRCFNQLVVIKCLDQNAPILQQNLFSNELEVYEHLTGCADQTHWLSLLDNGQDSLLFKQQQYQVSYMMLPYIASGSLDKIIITKNDWPSHSLKGIGALMNRLISAIDQLHQCGWLHLDLKPSNILIKSDLIKPDVVFIDFALTKPINSLGVELKVAKIDRKITQGTPQYMSPEQFLAQDLNQQTDYYALGLVFYQLLTGKFPFCIGADPHANSYQQWAVQHCQQAVPLLPKPLACFQSLIDGLLAKERQNRLQTAAQIRYLLNNAFSNLGLD